MRDPARIKPLMAKLANMWQQYVPDWRFGQLICNVLGSCKRDPWFYEEQEMLKVFHDYFGMAHHDGVAS